MRECLESGCQNKTGTYSYISEDGKPNNDFCSEECYNKHVRKIK